MAKVAFKVHSRNITRKVQRANARAMRQLAEEMTLRLKMVLNAQGTRTLRSKPGEPPRKQSGDLQKSASVVFDRKNTLQVNTALYGIYLDKGVPRNNLKPRPWLNVSIKKEKRMWNKRYWELLKSFSK